MFRDLPADKLDEASKSDNQGEKANGTSALHASTDKKTKYSIRDLGT